MRLKLAIVSSHPIQYQTPLFRELARRDVDLNVLFCSDFGTTPSFDPGFGKTIQYDVPLLDGYRYEFMPNLSPRPHIGTTGLVNPTVARRIVAGAYDAVILHGYSVITNLLALLAPRGARPKILLRGDSNAGAPVTRLRAAVKQVVLRSIFSRVDHFLTSGSANDAYYRRYGVSTERMTFAPFSVDNAYFASRAERARRDRTALRRSLFAVTDERPVVVYAGKLLPHKRPADALRGFVKARARAPMSLAFVGDGPLSNALRNEAGASGVSDDVHFLGFKNQSELPGLFAAADALVLPSEHEPWGLAINEAMAAGLAIAVSDRVGCAADLVTDNGAIFPVGDTAAVAQVMIEWATMPHRLAAQKDASLRIISHWDIRDTADGFLAGAERSIRDKRTAS